MVREQAVIPAPPDAGEDFIIGEVLTVYQAAMVYADRHPHERFLATDAVRSNPQEIAKNAQNFMTAGHERNRPEAKLSWDICNEIIRRIENSKIRPIKAAYLLGGEIDIVHATIHTKDVLKLACERGDCPERALKALKTIGGDKIGKISARPTPEAELLSWFKGYVEECVEAARIPTQEDDEKAARAKFGQGVTRKRVRALRRQTGVGIPESWYVSRRGRKPKVLQ